jgi:hypothetical protein
MPNFNPLPLDLANDRYVNAITTGGVKTAVLSIATQLSTFRFAADVNACVALLRDLVDDILRCQTAQSPAPVLPLAAQAESLITDATTQTAMGTIRTYLAGISAATSPGVGQLPLKNAFGPLAARIVEAI